MTGFQPSAALLRTRIFTRSENANDSYFETGDGTKPASKFHQKQAAARAAERVVRQTRRKHVTSEERSKQIQRRRKWASGGNMPPEIRACYSEAERAALAVIADRCRRNGFCDMCIDEIARLAGVGRTSVQNAIRKAQSKGLAHISVRERPQKFGKSLTNIIKIVSKSWVGWIMRAIGFKSLNASVTHTKTSLFETAETEKAAFEKECVASSRSSSNRTDQRSPQSGQNRSRWWRASTVAHS